MASGGLLERLKNGGHVLIAEGYVMEMERRGYMQAGGFIPEVVLEHPEMVQGLHKEFIHAGTDVVEAFTYYGHREKLRAIGREDDLEKLNRTALKIAREVANETGTLMAGGLCCTTIYEEDHLETHDKVRSMFKEQVEWAAEEGADYIIAETIHSYGEAKLALEAIQQHGKGIPAVVTLTCLIPDETMDGMPIAEACRKLEDAGADVVGLNCGRGPSTMLPALKEIRKACNGPIAALPVTYRTKEDCRTWHSLKDPDTGKHVFPRNLACVMSSRDDIREFAEEAKAIGINYIGLCCGNSPFYFRELAEVYGRKPEACKYSPDLSLNFILKDTNEYAQRLRQFAMTGKK
ncbi:betaine--homocysteine S-methyltransferase 1-like [Mizuhopecten yessoensis]|uniref:Betaine--homocysteine S-methyltransferase 1 n=1 Tax=Mizuhopecten yessoensis TaxID=6573 RepID=A0A210QAU2_MIZYE|nr:betaine--homocysteine S-methyltransferase 1-like [Mizuhopecten yessoensis]XP_021362755.1 betaine--homocysteine S-methyltransferase 1-like [Mizuhopecten yessoensis]OWF45856.1 Betaine--homocysteine S-methyltransferase 1 [Mizuhopecten yessoensis]